MLLLVAVRVCYCVLRLVSGCYGMLPFVTGCYSVLLVVTTDYCMLLFVADCYWLLLVKFVALGYCALAVVTVCRCSSVADTVFGVYSTCPQS